MNKSKQAVAAMLDQATAAATSDTIRSRLAGLTGDDFPALACLLDLLAEHPAVTGDNTLAGAVGAIQTIFSKLWDYVEEVAA